MDIHDVVDRLDVVAEEDRDDVAQDDMRSLLLDMVGDGYLESGPWGLLPTPRLLDDVEGLSYEEGRRVRGMLESMAECVLAAPTQGSC